MRVTPQEGNRKHQNQNPETQQTKFNHRIAESNRQSFVHAASLARVAISKLIYQDAPNRGDQSDDEERLGDENVRANGDAKRMRRISASISTICNSFRIRGVCVATVQ
jgi:hypothetical protein